MSNKCRLLVYYTVIVITATAQMLIYNECSAVESDEHYILAPTLYLLTDGEVGGEFSNYSKEK